MTKKDHFDYGDIEVDGEFFDFLADIAYNEDIDDYTDLSKTSSSTVYFRTREQFGTLNWRIVRRQDESSPESGNKTSHFEIQTYYTPSNNQVDEE